MKLLSFSPNNWGSESKWGWFIVALFFIWLVCQPILKRYHPIFVVEIWKWNHTPVVYKQFNFPICSFYQMTFYVNIWSISCCWIFKHINIHKLYHLRSYPHHQYYLYHRYHPHNSSASSTFTVVSDQQEQRLEPRIILSFSEPLIFMTISRCMPLTSRIPSDHLHCSFFWTHQLFFAISHPIN
jgi:hypothetical protein